MTFIELRDAQLGSVGEAALAWRLLARQVGELERRVVHELDGPLRASGWSGVAAEAAFRRLSGVGDQVELSALQSRLVAAVLGRAASEFVDVQRQLHGALDAVALLRLQVDETGRVSPGLIEDWQRHSEEGQADWRRQCENARIYDDLIGKILDEANDRDAEIQRALLRLQPDGPGAMDVYEWKDAVNDARNMAATFGVTEAAIPRPGSDPVKASEWWRGLTEDERQLYLTAYPEQVGAVDGLPASARDEANRLGLRAHLGELAMASAYSEQDEREKDRLSNLLGRLEGAEYGPPGQQLFLIGLDNANDGKAIVAVGNPDDSRHTAVVVPGTGTKLDGMRGQIDRALDIQGAAARYAGPTGGPVSVVAWLGYDTPGIDGSAVSYRLSKEGGQALDGFVNGLHAAHTADSSHVTALGHSYGSAVVGEAASRGDGLAVNDIITAGSPGMHVDSASQLHLDPRHVWAGGAADDPMTGAAGSIWGIHDDEPTDPSFGANRYHVDTTGHSGYWKPESTSLNNQARIIVGMYPDVTLDHGKAPQ
ncbi:alpha/beta hydrolase [Micromonospora sp. NPDC048839]|uniref:alpha/beta hydrolase n=1 Tax=Micromonospora sp. NPDC048839 TaxID=3155641 RepID=UPI0033CE6570